MKRLNSVKKAITAVLPRKGTSSSTQSTPPSPPPPTGWQKAPAAAEPAPVLTLAHIWATSPTHSLVPSPDTTPVRLEPAAYAGGADLRYSTHNTGAGSYAASLPKLGLAAQTALHYAECRSWPTALARGHADAASGAWARHRVEARFVPLLNISSAGPAAEGTRWAPLGSPRFWADAQKAVGAWGANAAVVVRWGKGEKALPPLPSGADAVSWPFFDPSSSPVESSDEETTMAVPVVMRNALAAVGASSQKRPRTAPRSGGESSRAANNRRQNAQVPPQAADSSSSSAADKRQRRITIWPGPNAPKE